VLPQPFHVHLSAARNRKTVGSSSHKVIPGTPGLPINPLKVVANCKDARQNEVVVDGEFSLQVILADIDDHKFSAML
jgi:hypothetical protein